MALAVTPPRTRARTLLDTARMGSPSLDEAAGEDRRAGESDIPPLRLNDPGTRRSELRQECGGELFGASSGVLASSTSTSEGAISIRGKRPAFTTTPSCSLAAIFNRSRPLCSTQGAAPAAAWGLCASRSLEV